MPTSMRRRLRLARRAAGLAVAVALVLVALVIGVANQLLPLAERHPDRVAAWLAERTGRPIAFSAVETSWTRRGPVLSLRDLRVGAPDGGGQVVVGDAEMLVSLYAGLLPGTPFSELRLRGLDLTLERDAAGRWQVRGLPGQQDAGADPFDALEGLGELQVVGGRLAVLAPDLGLRARIPRVDLRLRVDGDRVRAGLRAWPGSGAAPLDVALYLERDTGDGRAYASLRDADLGGWSNWLHVAGVAPAGGHGHVSAWATLRAHRLDAVVVEAALQRLRLRGAPLRDERGLVSVPGLEFDAVDARLRWARGADGWRLDAPRLRLVPGAPGSPPRAHVLDGLLVAGGTRSALAGPRIDVGPLLALAALGDRLSPGVRGWLLAARPVARLEDVSFAAADGRAIGSARVSGAGFGAAGDAPGLAGLAGALEGDAEGLAFMADPAATVRVDWPRGFGTAHAFRLAGTLAGWRDGSGWQLATPSLRLAGDSLDVALRGGLAWQGDGTRPRIDMAAEVERAPLPLARGFLVRHRMPPGAVRWLDDALVSGTLQDGRALVAGDLDDWPFRAVPGMAAAGVFRADVRIADAVLRFHRDWPAVEVAEADARFVADGFDVQGRGEVSGVAIERFEAGIARYGEALLQVRANGAGDASDLLALLRDSPVRDSHGATLERVEASGPAAVTFSLRQSLRRDAGPPRLSGTVALEGARLRETQFDLDFQRVRGRAVYDRSGFRADRLQARFEGRPAMLALRAGNHVRAPANAFEATLATTLDADALLRHAPRLDWLAPYLSGRADWTAVLALPREGTGRLQLESDLAGTTLSLPAPLDKAAGAALAARVVLPIPLERGDVEVSLGEDFAARARIGDAGTGVRVALGTGAVAGAPPATGLVATGRAAVLAPLDWIGLAGGGGDSGTAFPLRSVDVVADRLVLFGGAFPDTRMRVSRLDGGALSVQVNGEAREGTVRGPAADRAAVSGRLARLHWRSAAPGVAGDAPAATAEPSAGDAPDPRRIPPLAFAIDDLRFNDAPLGTAELRTRPVPNGLRVDMLRTQSARHRLELDGEWIGRGLAARTRVDARFRSEDFGALLSGLGQGGRIDGGTGTARLQAAWPGSPAAFRLADLQGSLAVDVRDGRLLEVEPGAGRVLGLLSLAELPRRLTLDFRDFFSKGFAFNQVEGRVSFDDGVARSEQLAMDGPAAAITIRGTANLRAQTFDQRIDVRPKAGNVLTVVGAIAGGPVGAALGAAANAVLQKPLGEAAARTYRVTGPWKDPQVEVVQRGETSASTPPQHPSR